MSSDEGIKGKGGRRRKEERSDKDLFKRVGMEDQRTLIEDGEDRFGSDLPVESVYDKSVRVWEAANH